MEKALIEKMNGDMKEIQVLWEKVGNSEDDKKTWLTIKEFKEKHQDILFCDFLFRVQYEYSYSGRFF